MKAFQLIYTKVDPGDSPWGKSGWHTVFYPLDLLTRAQVLDLETRIHRPEDITVAHKTTVFFLRLGASDYLIILDLNEITDAKDQYGRSIFLCQGFLFPPEIWRQAPSPLSLLPLVESARFPDRAAVLASPCVNRTTGDIEPIPIAEEQLQALPQQLPALVTDYERRLAMLLNRWAETDPPPFVLLFKGAPDAVAALLNWVSAYVPDALKSRLGWDAALDGGDLYQYPLKIAGYSQHKPRRGDPLELDLAAPSLQLKPEWGALLEPRTPFQRWLHACPDEATTKDRLEQAYRLSNALLGEQPLREDKCFDWSRFAACNRDLVETQFLNRAQARLGDDLAGHVARDRDLTPAGKLDCLLDDMPPARLADIIEHTLFKQRLRPRRLPAEVVASGSQRLRLLDRALRGETLSTGDFAMLEPTERLELARFFLDAPEAPPWFGEVLKEDAALFEACWSYPETHGALRELLLTALRSQLETREIAGIVLEQALVDGDGFAILTGQINPLQSIESLLRSAQANERTLKQLVAWAQKHPPAQQPGPYTTAFLFPRQDLSETVLNDRRVQSLLAVCLVSHHGYGVTELRDLGFPKVLVEQVEAQTKGGLFDRMLKTFGFSKRK
jgi:hypothetical protein